MKIEKKVQEEIAEGIKKQLGSDVAVSISVRSKIAKTPDFVMLYQEVGKKILEGEISLSTFKVFYYLIVNMDFENFVGIDMKTLSEKINMPLRTVTLAMKQLKDAGMIISIKNNWDNRRNDYRLNPIIAWKGKVNSRAKVLKTDPAQFNLLLPEN